MEQKRQYYHHIHNQDFYNILQSFLKKSLKILREKLEKENNSIESYIDLGADVIEKCRTDLSYRTKINYHDEELIQMGCNNFVSDYWEISTNNKLLIKTIDKLLLIKSIQMEFLKTGYIDNKSGKEMEYNESAKKSNLDDLLFSLVSYYLYLGLDHRFDQKAFMEAFFIIQEHSYGRYNFNPFVFFTLVGFESNRVYIRLGDGYAIRRINHYDRINNNDLHKIGIYEQYQLVFRYDRKLKYTKTGDPIGTYDDAVVKLHKMIDGLKLFKEGRIIPLKRYEIRFNRNPLLRGEKSGQQISLTNPYYYKNYTLQHNEITNLQKFLSKYFEITNNQKLTKIFDIPISRFCNTNDPTNLENRIIDLFIVLESLFSRDEQSLTH